METERLIIRNLNVKDATEMYENWASDSEVTRYLTWTPHESVDETRQVINNWIDEYAGTTTFTKGIVLKENGKLIGTIGAIHMDCESKWAEIGYCIGKTFWGNGYVAEALYKMLEYLFCEYDIERVIAVHDIENNRSGSVMKKAGMTFVKTEVSSNNRGNIEVCKYQITKEDYQNNKKGILDTLLSETC